MEISEVFENFEGSRAGIFRSETTTVEASGHATTDDAAPLQTACAEGRHYACGAKRCSCDCHNAPKRKSRNGSLLTVFGVILVLGIALAFSWNRGHELSAVTSPQLSQPAVKFAVYLVTDDLETGLTNGKSGIAQTSKQDLLTWVRLDDNASSSIGFF